MDGLARMLLILTSFLLGIANVQTRLEIRDPYGIHDHEI